MTGQRPDDETFLRSHISDLPESIEPERDLWPPIAARLAPRGRARPRRALYQLAAAIALVLISSAVTWFLARKSAAPVVVVATAPVDRAGLARLARAGDVMEEGLGSSDLAPRNPRRAHAKPRCDRLGDRRVPARLDADPGSPVLAGLLRAAHRQRVEFLQQAARLPAPEEMLMRPVAILLTLLLPLPLAAQQRIDRRMAVSSTASIRINDLVGMVRLVGWDRDSLVVVGELPARAGQLYFGGSRDAAKLGLEGTDTSSVVSSATLEVRVPRGARVSVRGATVSLDAGGLEGDLDFITTTGRLHLEGAPRIVTAETLDGNVEVAGPATSIRVRTAGGTVVLRGIRGDLSVTTVSGAILIGGARVTRARLETVSGEIAWKGAIERGGSLDTQTHSGNIEPDSAHARRRPRALRSSRQHRQRIRAPGQAGPQRHAPHQYRGRWCRDHRADLPGQDIPRQAARSGRKPRGAGRHLRDEQVVLLSRRGIPCVAL
jgi:hypothetical protein